jgi:hypothetical protein
MVVIHKESYTLGREVGSTIAEDTAEKIENAWKDNGLKVIRSETTQVITLEYTSIYDAKKKVKG